MNNIKKDAGSGEMSNHLFNQIYLLTGDDRDLKLFTKYVFSLQVPYVSLYNKWVKGVTNSRSSATKFWSILEMSGVMFVEQFSPLHGE